MPEHGETMPDIDDIVRRLSGIEGKLDEVHDWMHRRLGEEAAFEKNILRRAWTDRIVAGVIVGVIVTAFNWMLI